MKASILRICARVLGLTLCTVPAAIAVLEHFPIWIGEGIRPTLSAMSVIMLVLAAIPLKRAISKYLESPSAWSIWLAIWALSTLLTGIIYSIARIALVAFVGNALGAVCFRLARERKD